MTYVPRRSTQHLHRGARFLVVVGLFATFFVPRTAGAYSISQIQAKINRLSNELATLDARSASLSQQYDLVRSQLQALDGEIHALRHKAAQKQKAMNATAQKLTTSLIRAYVDGSASNGTIALLDQNVTQSDARHVFEVQAIGNLRAIESTLSNQRNALEKVLSTESRKRAEAAAAARQVNSLLRQNNQLDSQTRYALHQVTKALAAQIIAYEMSQALSAARHHNTQGVTQAVAAASQVGGQDAANRILAAVAAITTSSVSGSPAGTKEGNAAVAWAKGQIGVPYVWGGETPGQGFDCSGLTQWAWRKAGYSIPRTAAEQYNAMRHVRLDQLRPGDLLFYYNLDNDHQVDHVVMYVGSGPWGANTIIAAAHTGTLISLEPLFTYGLIGAGRP